MVSITSGDYSWQGQKDTCENAGLSLARHSDLCPDDEGCSWETTTGTDNVLECEDGTLCSVDVGSCCPADFPYPHVSLPEVCYNHESYTSGGPCGSWCTLDAAVGSGCGDNSGNMCSSNACEDAWSCCSAQCTNQSSRETFRVAADSPINCTQATTTAGEQSVPLITTCVQMQMYVRADKTTAVSRTARRTEVFGRACRWQMWSTRPTLGFPTLLIAMKVRTTGCRWVRAHGLIVTRTTILDATVFLLSKMEFMEDLGGGRKRKKWISTLKR